MIALPIISILILLYYTHKGIVGAKKRNYARYGLGYKQRYWFSVKPVNKCLFSRRNEIEGKVFLLWSVRLRINGKEII